MRNIKIIAYCCVVATMAGCTVTGRLGRKQYTTDLGHSTRQQREYIEQETSAHRPGYIEYTRADSTTVFLIPTVKTADGETMMQLNIDEVVVVAKSRSLPERLGKVNIDFVITLPDQLQGNCRTVVVTPMLHKNTEDMELEELTIRGGLFDKVQQRNYWQLDTYRDRFNPDSIRERWAFHRFISHPYPEGVRLDSVVRHRGTLKYYYTQEVKTDQAGGMLKVTLKGKVVGLDRRQYRLPLSDTLEYSISSMLAFVDTTTRYMTRVIEKYAVVNDRNYLTFPVNRSQIIDTLANNRPELERIEALMDEIVRQKEFHIDSVILTATASPEGAVSRNEQLSKARAHALRDRLVKKFPGVRMDTLITLRWIGEDWDMLGELVAGDGNIQNREAILDAINLRDRKNPDRTESEIKAKFPADYKYIFENIYPKLRAVSFKYDLRRVGMVKDTIHTTVPDTLYARGVRLLQERKYNDALVILQGFYDRNTAVCLLSLGHDGRAYDVLKNLPQSATVEYLSAIAAARLGRESEALDHFDNACTLNENLKYRGNLDPELSTLIKKREDETED